MTFDAYVGISPPEPRCWELVRRVYRDRLGIDLPARDTLDGPALVEKVEADAASETWEEVGSGFERPYDLALMRGWFRGEGGELRSGLVHVGLVVERGRVLHCEPGMTSAISRYGLRVGRFLRHRTQCQG